MFIVTSAAGRQHRVTIDATTVDDSRYSVWSLSDTRVLFYFYAMTIEDAVQHLQSLGCEVTR